MSAPLPAAEAAPVPQDAARARIARRNVAVLVAAQALLGAQMPMIFTVAGLAGQWLTPIACLATAPISLTVFGTMTTAPWLGPLMQRRGRRFGFVLGAIAGGAAGALGAAALTMQSFWLFVAASYLTGIYMAAQGFYRFAAADGAPEDFRPRAISYVLAGGLVSAVIGPQLVKVTADALPTPFLGTYLAVVALNAVGMWLFFLLREVPPAPEAADPGTEDAARPARRLGEILTDGRIVVAMSCAAVAYALMNLVMTSTPLAVVGCGYEKADAANIVSAHVLAMFVPSFFTGHLIARFGAVRIVWVGLALLAGAGAVALAGVELTNFYGALILLGLGWNFGFIGATTMLTAAYRPEERGLVQGINDMVVFGAVTVASLASGGLMNCLGGSPVEGWSMVNLAMVPFLAYAGAALIWLTLRAPARR